MGSYPSRQYLYQQIMEKDLRILKLESQLAERDARLKEAEAIIKPFADNAPVFNGEDEDKEIWGNPNMDLTVDNLRRARAFLAGGE